ncbi:MAG: DUF4130 domain-containing protein [Spirochaetaceae bacterium]|nr:DUF4130 domain-containing protein [Spirochaetaceae bacterium]
MHYIYQNNLQFYAAAGTMLAAKQPGTISRGQSDTLFSEGVTINNEQLALDFEEQLAKNYGDNFILLINLILADDKDLANQLIYLIKKVMNSTILSIKNNYDRWQFIKDMLNNIDDNILTTLRQVKRKNGAELYKYLGFVRFDGNQNCRTAFIRPEADLAPILMTAFIEKFKTNLALFDEGRGYGLIYFDKKIYRKENLPDIKTGDDYGELFKTYIKSITIEERINHKLQAGLVPYKNRKFMTEFN